MTTDPASKSAPGCPFKAAEAPAKSAAIAAARLKVGGDAERIRSYARAREILLSKELLQGGAGAEFVDASDPDTTPVFFLDGAAHHERRASIGRYFTPKAITSRYHAIIERETARLVAQIVREGRARLDVLSFELTVAVAANIVGLTESAVPAMARRLATILSTIGSHRLGPLGKLAVGARKALAMGSLYVNDIAPAVRARRQAPRDDVLSQLIAKGASRRTLVIECMTYAAAGMVTTRELIVMAAWYLFEDRELRADFLAGDEGRQLAILTEILRIEPIASLLTRRSDPGAGPSSTYAIDLRAIHVDEAGVGPCRTRSIRRGRSRATRTAPSSASAPARTIAPASRSRCTSRGCSSMRSSGCRGSGWSARPTSAGRRS